MSSELVEQPRIVVEVKHRPNSAMGAPEIRSFLGGRHSDDKGLYVSTGGFTKEARYEAKRVRALCEKLNGSEPFMRALYERFWAQSKNY